VNAFKNTLKIWHLAGGGCNFRYRLISFLCARLGNLSEKRRLFRSFIFNLIGRFAQNSQVAVRFHPTSADRPLSIFLRQDNKADYLVFGEMVMQAHKLSVTLPVRPSCAVDGGANIGLFALFAHATFPGIKLTCYEPDEKNIVQLRKNLEANNINAEVVPKALWSKSAELYFHPGESYSGFVNEDYSPFPISCTLPKVPEGCWLKLDIEGAEYEVLPALLELNCHPSIISMEIHDYNRRGDRLLSLLKAHDYYWNEEFKPTEQCVNICALRRIDE